MILFIHEKKHVGGGQSFVQAYKENFDKLNIKIDFSEGLITKKIIKNIFFKKYYKAFIHTYSPKYLPLFFLLKIRKIPIVITVYGVWFLESKSQNPMQSPKKTFWLKITQQLVFLCCNTLIVFSKYEKQLIEQHFICTKNKTKIIPGGIDLQRFNPVSPETKKQIRKKLHLPLNSTIFLIVSRLERRKGIDVAIKAFSKIVKSHPKSFLCIIFPTGEFTYFEVISECFQHVSNLDIGKNVHFITGVNPKYIPLYFQASDFFLMSSIDLETFGLTTIEAAGSGLIPIGFNSGATPEFLKKIYPKLIVYPINPKSLAKKMDWLLSLSKYDQQKIRQKCLNLAKKYSWKNINNALCKIFK